MINGILVPELKNILTPGKIRKLFLLVLSFLITLLSLKMKCFSPILCKDFCYMFILSVVLL